MNDTIIQIIFGALLTVITGLMGWQALAIIAAGRSIAVIENALKGMAEDLKRVSHHDSLFAQQGSLIAVLNSEVSNLKADTSFLFEKVRELERDDKPTIHRRQ